VAVDQSDQIAHAYGQNAARLRAAKARFDPDGVFSATSLPPGRQSPDLKGEYA